jgi:hypothetical protein
MGWLIFGLLVLLLVGGLIGFMRVREHDRQPTDDTLVAELLGEDIPHPPDGTAVLSAAHPPDGTAVLSAAHPPGDIVHPADDIAVLPAAHPPEDTEVLPVAPPPRAAEAPPIPNAPAGPDSPASTVPAQSGAQPPASGGPEDGDWLESQLAWIRNWSQRMQDQLGSGTAQDPDRQD